MKTSVPCLVSIDEAADVFEFTTPQLTLGRHPDNDIVLTDARVSKFHAQIVQSNDSYWVRDLGSSNGTVLNDVSVREHVLCDGDVLSFGKHRLRFLLDARSLPSPLLNTRLSIVSDMPHAQTQVLTSSPMRITRSGADISNLSELQGQYDRMRIAFEAVQSLLRTTHIDQLCQDILAAVYRLVNAETAAVLLWKGDGTNASSDASTLVPRAVRYATHLHAELPNGSEHEIIVSQTLLDHVLQHKAAVLAADARRDRRWSASRSMVMSGVRSLLCVPLCTGDTVHGLLHVGNNSKAGAFSPADLQLLMGLGAGAAVALQNAIMRTELAEEARRRDSLGRFLSPILVERVMRDELSLVRGGQSREVTVLFADIRGFTSLTERSAPDAVVRLLNEYFEQMVETVFRHRGVLDKFMGDGLMAVWGTPESQADDAPMAIAASRDMQRTLASYNALRQERNEAPIAIGIGIASGECIVGNIGAQRRMEYTVIGNAVNLASRLSGLAQPGQVLCDTATFERAGAPRHIRSCSSLHVKGKRDSVMVYQVETHHMGS